MRTPTHGIMQIEQPKDDEGEGYQATVRAEEGGWLSFSGRIHNSEIERFFDVVRTVGGGLVRGIFSGETAAIASALGPQVAPILAHLMQLRTEAKAPFLPKPPTGAGPVARPGHATATPLPSARVLLHSETDGDSMDVILTLAQADRLARELGVAIRALETSAEKKGPRRVES